MTESQEQTVRMTEPAEAAAEADSQGLLCSICFLDIEDHKTGTKRDSCGHCFHDACLHSMQAELKLRMDECPSCVLVEEALKSGKPMPMMRKPKQPAVLAPQPAAPPPAQAPPETPAPEEQTARKTEPAEEPMAPSASPATPEAAAPGAPAASRMTETEAAKAAADDRSLLALAGSGGQLVGAPSSSGGELQLAVAMGICRYCGYSCEIKDCQVSGRGDDAKYRCKTCAKIDTAHHLVFVERDRGGQAGRKAGRRAVKQAGRQTAPVPSGGLSSWLGSGLLGGMEVV